MGFNRRSLDCRHAGRSVARAPRHRARPGAAEPDGPLLRQEPRAVHEVQLGRLPDRAFRHLLLPRDRTSPRTDRRLRRERLQPGQLRPQARPGVQGADDHLQDLQRFRAAERHPRRGAGRGGGLRGIDARPDAAAARRASRPALPDHHPRTGARLPVRHHPAVAHPAERAPVGERGALGLRHRILGPGGPGHRAGRGGVRQRPEDDRVRGLRQLQQSAPRLQSRPRRLRVHRVTVGPRGGPPVPVRDAQGDGGGRRGPLRRRLQAEARRLRPAVREVPQGPVQAVPRQGAAGRLRQGPGAETGEVGVHPGAHRRAVALGRPAGDSHGQPQGPRVRHRPGVGEGRIGHSQSHPRLLAG